MAACALNSGPGKSTAKASNSASATPNGASSSICGPAAASSGQSSAPTTTPLPGYDQRELDHGDVIAYGTTDIEGYGTTPLERAQFIVDTIRIHLTRQACTHQHDDLASIQAILGTSARWCPTCGTRLCAR
jgi:hypothetical protein